MKALIALLITLSIIPVSIVVMIHGWGLSAENWGWVSFGYLWMVVAPVSVQAMK